MARYGMDYDRGFRGSGDYARDFRDGGGWDRDEFTSGTRQYNTMHNDWHINRDSAPLGRGQSPGRPLGGGYESYGGGYGAQGSFGFGRQDRNLDQGGYGEAGWTGWSGGQGGYGSTGGNPGGQGNWSGYNASTRGFGGMGNRGYDVDDYQRFSAGSGRGYTRGGMSGGGYSGGGYTGGMGGERYTGGFSGSTGGGYSGGGFAGGNQGGGYTGGGYTGGYAGGAYTGSGMNRGVGGYASGWNRDYGSDYNNRGYDHDIGDRVREGWDHLRDRARNFFRR